MWTALLNGLLAVQVHQAVGMEYRGNTYSVQELSQEFSSPGAGDPANYAPWAEDDHAPFFYSGGSGYVEAERPYMTYPASDYPSHYVPQTVEDGHVYQESVPSIHAYKPSFSGKDYNEYPHILPPGGKSIEQLQQEADLRVKKIYFDSRENQKLVGEKVKKLKDTYGYGTIGFPGYKNTIRYEPIDLGTHNAIDLGSTVGGLNGNVRLPVQTVTLTKTLGVRVPQPYPVRQEIPVPAPFPVPVTDPHDEDNVHTSREVKQYLDAFASDFSVKSSFGKADTVPGKSFGSTAKRENSRATAATTALAPMKTYTGFRPSFGVYAVERSPSVPPRTIYQF